MKSLLLSITLLVSTTVFADPSFADALADALASPDRLPADSERDARSHPDVVLPLLQLKAGDRVADIWGGGGYYSELVAASVGADGEVLLANNEAYAAFLGGAIGERLDRRGLEQITIHTREADNLDFGVGTLDSALIIMSYHDVYYVDEPNGWSPVDAPLFLRQIFDALKSGGRFLIVDHNAAAGSGAASAQDLHRIERDFAINDITSSGFTLVDETDVLRNPDDDYSISVFDPAVRGKTDRFVLVFEKP